MTYKSVYVPVPKTAVRYSLADLCGAKLTLFTVCLNLIACILHDRFFFTLSIRCSVPVMHQQEALDLYESVAQISERMLATARAWDWDGHAELMHICDLYIQQIPPRESAPVLTGADALKKLEYLTQILANDREIDNLRQPWIEDLTKLLNGSRFHTKS